MAATDPEHDPAQIPSPMRATPTAVQRAWLRRGLDQPGGKLPLFTEDGQRITDRTIRSCIDHGWAAPWFDNPLKPSWLVCRLTPRGAAVVREPGSDDGVPGPGTASS
jgi:hypothetical protein